MKTKLDNAQQDDSTHKATDIMLVEHPLEFIAEDHLRAKTMAEAMRSMASAEQPGEKDINEIMTFLENELPLLMHDEDDDLLVLLQSRVTQSDGFDLLTTQLAEIHTLIESDRKNLLMRLGAAKANHNHLSADDRGCIQDMAKRLLADMIIENAKLLPLARQRLTHDDIAVLRNNMIQRRISDMRGARDNAR